MSPHLLSALLCALAVVLAQAVPQGRIVGGQPAMPGMFPHQISLQSKGRHICGASIVSRNYLLTAAHCVTYEDKDGLVHTSDPITLKALAGTTNRLMGGVELQVEFIKVHENFGSFQNDVALLKLSESLNYTTTIQPIALASDEPPAGSPVVISGWGRLSTLGRLPVFLQWNVLVAMSAKQCSTVLEIFKDGWLCLGHSMGNGACSGDSGGPATYKDELVGVAGFVINGCASIFPDGYANVAYYKGWIKENSDV